MDINNGPKTLSQCISVLLMKLSIFNLNFPQMPAVSPVQIQRFWIRQIISFCFTASIEIAVQSAQWPSPCSPLFSWLALAISLAFAAVFVATSIDASRFVVLIHVLEHLSVFFAATAFFIAISIPFPMYIKCVSWTVYVISLLAISVCHLY